MMGEITTLREQLAAAQATNERLREALELIYNGSTPAKFIARLALKTQADESVLQERLAQERKEIADTCDRFHERGMTPAECAAHIRSMT